MSSLRPFHSESERDFYAHLGLYAELWSGVEGAIEFLIEFIYKNFGGLTVEPEPPLALERRLKFLRKAAKRLPELSSEEAEIVRMTDFLRDESSFRHLLIHGRNQHFLKEDPHFAFMVRPKDRKAPFGDQHETVVTQADIERHYHELGYVSICIFACISRLRESLKETDMAATQRRSDR